jgi:2-aminoethylphosphonate-pyruvate transaminase
MSAFGALPIGAAHIPFDSLTASSNKCLEGVPGVGFSIIRRSHLATCEGVSSSVSLDLYEQWRGFERNGQWRFTPPTHVMAALDSALVELEREGGVEGRLGRYQRSCGALVTGMRELGFETLLKDSLQAPIIVTFLSPAEQEFEFQRFYDCLKARGFVIYPGKLTTRDTFRVGCIGQVDAGIVSSFLMAVSETIVEMGLTSCRSREG